MPIRVARVIGRLNVGGPAVQAIRLTRELERAGFETRLFRGREGSSEGSMDYLAEETGIAPTEIPHMRRDVGPRDLPALAELARELRRFRPDIVHTEAAKAGTLGRLAGLVCRTPVLVHTFHGHSLEGYFSPRRARFFGAVERLLARRTAVLIAVSEEVKQDLVRLRVAAPERIQVIPVGIDLVPFQVDGEERAARRSEQRRRWGLSEDATVVTLVARLVPIKRVDRFLRIAATLAERDAAMRFVVVGDGELRSSLEASAPARRLGERLRFAGLERDMPAVCFASDCVVLTSDNEGTPVSLIEAHAAGLPAVGTRVGGTASVVADGITGRLVDRDDECGFAAAVEECLARRDTLGAAARPHVVRRYSIERLVGDLDALYRRLLEARRPDGAPFGPLG